MVSINQTLRQEGARIARQVQYIETAVHPDFQLNFVDDIGLPHSRDQFPHLEGIINRIPASPTRTRQRPFPREERRG